jgi:hypothetical protein
VFPPVSSIGVPVKLLHEGEGHVVTIELKNGETYRGLLSEAEDTMNCQLKEGKPCMQHLNISPFYKYPLNLLNLCFSQLR